MIAALVLPGLAAAADMPVKAPRAFASSADWTQFYAGFGIGFDAETGHTTVGGFGGVGTVDGFQGADLGVTATLGFDAQVSRLFVVGGFVDYDWSRERTRLTLADPFFSETGRTPTLHDAWTVGARAGVLVRPDVLVYGLAGYTGIQLDNWSFTSSFGPILQEPGLHTHGLTLGGGIEYRLADNLSLRGEYRHVSLGSETNVDGVGLVWTTSMSEHIARLIATYRLGVPGITGATAAEPVPARNWTGFYGGLGLGGDAITPHIDATLGVSGLGDDGLAGADFAGTAMVGYDRQVLPRWVVGAFGLLDLGSNGNRQVSAGSGGGGTISGNIPAVERSWTVGGRAGFLVAPDTLVYALAGYTGTTFHAVTYNLIAAAGTAQSPEFHGATVGAGFEKLFTDNLSARLEYRHTELDTLPVVAPGFDSASASAGVHAVRLIMSYRLPSQ
ncbi:MAG TPA: outer membrane beta-barrel protein [Xanthobacteraceae bacterium]|nr:outer membrane beta-barrel protein [Xanthobacteraceae bacterium]